MSSAETKGQPTQPPHEKPVPPNQLAAVERLMQVIDTLRSPGGCDWDQKQTVETLAPHLIEECHEMADAVARSNADDTSEELGDLLMGVLMTARVAGEDRGFGIIEICNGIVEKLIRRHPHVYGEVEVDGTGEILRNWEQIKKQEKADKGQDESVLGGVPRSLPALLRAYRVGNKASNAGFDWPDLEGPFHKVDEEWAEFREAAEQSASGKAADHKRAEEELGDLLFAVVNVARKLKIEPELALRGTIERFSSRFRYIEQHIDKPLAEATLEEMDVLWEQAKTSADGA